MESRSFFATEKLKLTPKPTSLDLVGTSRIFGGEISIVNSLDIPSIGNILALCDSQPDDFPAATFFDLFLKIKTPRGSFHNRHDQATKIVSAMSNTPVFRIQHVLLFFPAPIRDANEDIIGWIKDMLIDPSCPADLDGDGNVGIVDLLTLLAEWGTNPSGPPDFDADGNVGVTDLLKLLAN